MYTLGWKLRKIYMMINNKKLIKKSIDVSVSLIVVVFNIVEIVLIKRIKPSKRKNFEYVLLSLSIADLLFGLSNVIVASIFVTEVEIPAIVYFSYTSSFHFVVTSILHLVFIAGDRLTSVMFPIYHKVTITQTKLFRFIVLLWVLASASTVTLCVITEMAGHFNLGNRTIKANNKNNDSQITSINNNNNEGVFISNMMNVTNNSGQNKTMTILHNTSTINTRSFLSTTAKLPTTTITQQKVHKEDQVTSDGGGRTKPPKPGQGRPSDGRIYKNFMHNLLSYIVLIADLVLVLLYTIIIIKLQTIKYSNTKTKKYDQASVVCALVIVVFVTLTIPFWLKRLGLESPGNWVHILLVSNSGLNCVVYFFRERLSEKLGCLLRSKS